MASASGNSSSSTTDIGGKPYFICHATKHPIERAFQYPQAKEGSWAGRYATPALAVCRLIEMTKQKTAALKEDGLSERVERMAKYYTSKGTPVTPAELMAAAEKVNLSELAFLGGSCTFGDWIAKDKTSQLSGFINSADAAKDSEEGGSAEASKKQRKQCFLLIPEDRRAKVQLLDAGAASKWDTTLARTHLNGVPVTVHPLSVGATCISQITGERNMRAMKLVGTDVIMCGDVFIIADKKILAFIPPAGLETRALEDDYAEGPHFDPAKLTSYLADVQAAKRRRNE
jgi:hypothetical protein